MRIVPDPDIHEAAVACGRSSRQLERSAAAVTLCQREDELLRR
jgi:hypothetical protein